MKWIFTCFLAFGLTPCFSQSTITLSPEQMHKDLDILYAAWTTMHPGIYRYNTPQQLKNHFDLVKSKTTLPLDEKKFYLLLSQLAEKVKCGHTYLNPLNLKKKVQERILPAKVIPLFFVLDQKRRMIITHNMSINKSLNKGDEIVSINGVAVHTIIDSLLTVSRSDGMNATGKKLNNIQETPDEAEAYSLFDIYLPLFFPFTNDQLSLIVLPYNKSKKIQVNISCVSLADRLAVYHALQGSPGKGDEPFAYKLVKPDVAYMKFSTFAFWNSTFNPARYVDSVFGDLLMKRNVKNLVIDIRGNEGGDNTGYLILSYITKRKIGCDDPDRPSYRYLTISDSLLPYLDTWDPSFKKPKDPSRFFTNELGLHELKSAGTACDYIAPQKSTFNGQVWLLIDAKNSSAGYELARNFKTAKLGTLVGETTGGTQQGINGGEFFFMTLPNSGFEIDLPLIYNYHPGKPDKGITPDVQIYHTARSVAEGRDVQLEYVLRNLK